MTDGNEDAGLVSAEIGEMKRERRRRREALQNGVVPLRDEVHADAGELHLPSAPPPPDRSPSESFVAAGGSLVPVEGKDAEPSWLTGGLMVRLAIVGFWIVVVAWAAWSMHRSRKESSHDGK